MQAIPHASLTRYERCWPPGRLLAIVGLGLVAGCTGGGVVHTMPMIRNDFQPGEPPIVSVHLGEAYHWTGEDGGLNLALRYRHRSLLGQAFDREWLMSIVLDEAPAGSGKLYRIGRREIQVAQSYGIDYRRGRSINGVVVIETAGSGRLKARFQTLVRQQRFTALTGWSPPMNRSPVIIMAGEFTAVPGAGRGQCILHRTEADGFERPPITTRPATRPTTRPIRWIQTRPATTSAP